MQVEVGAVAPYEEKTVGRVANFCIGIVVLVALYAVAVMVLRLFR
jgi:hypothetical protein